MKNPMGNAKMTQDEQPAAILHNPSAQGNVLLVCEHASNRFPSAFGDLGLDAEAKQSHAAWDPGALAVAKHMSEVLDAKLVASTVSRLVYDCNRPPEAAGAMPAKSEKFIIPGNADLTDEAKKQRVDQVYRPFLSLLYGTITDAVNEPVLATIHSFTPVYNDQPRAVEIGILHDSDTRLADAMLALAPQFTGLNVQRNDPYGPEDGVTHTLKLHGLENGLMNVMIEVRNDLIATPEDQKNIAEMLADLISAALEKLENEVEK